MVGHVSPEAFDGGPIALVENGDIINIDIENCKIDLEVDETTLAARKAKWTAPEPKYKTGVFAKYIKTVGSASEGAITSKISREAPSMKSHSAIKPVRRSKMNKPSRGF